jgi:hypothetical protein
LDRSFLIIVLVLSAVFFRAQERDSATVVADSIAKQKAVNKAIYSRARKAAVMSAIIPGLGQAYNRKYWKIPVIYAGLGTLTYLLVNNQKKFKEYQTYLRNETDSDSLTTNPYDYNQDELLVQKKYYQKYRDLAAIGIVVVYLFNIIDANVDAHLMTFDVSDDLSLRIEPWQVPDFRRGRVAFTTGVSLKLNFR